MRSAPLPSDAIQMSPALVSRMATMRSASSWLIAVATTFCIRHTEPSMPPPPSAPSLVPAIAAPAGAEAQTAAAVQRDEERAVAADEHRRDAGRQFCVVDGTALEHAAMHAE